MPDPNRPSPAKSVEVLAALSASVGNEVAAYLEETGPEGLKELAAAVPDGKIAALTLYMSPRLAGVLQQAFSPDNRKPSPRNVLQHRRAVTEGRWQLTAEGPKADTSGVVVDGAHRLEGWLQAMDEDDAGWPRTMLFLGVSPDAVQEMDGGRKRSMYQQAKMTGWHHPAGSVLLSAAGRLWQWQRGWALNSGGTNVVPGVAEVREFTAQHPDLGELARHVKSELPPGMFGVAYLMVRWLTAQADPEASADFARQWGTGAGLEPGNPVLALRARAFRRSAREFHADTADEQLYVALRAWNAWCAGQPLAKIQLPRDGKVTNTRLISMKIARPVSDRWRSR